MSPRIALAFCLVGLGCNQSTLIELPEAGDAEAACVPHATVFCDASAPGLTTCVGGASADPNAALLPADASYPIGCIADVTGDTRNAVTGVCNLAAQCTCAGDPDAGDAAPAQWSCTP